MEYFKNFKNRITPQKAQPSHAEQLAKFRKCWSYVQEATEVNAENSKDKKLPPPEVHVSQTEIPQSLKTMVELLVDEGLRLEDVNTGVCMEELLRNKILSCLVELAEADKPQGVRGEVIRTVASMINLLDDRFLVHNAVHQPTIHLLRICVHDEPQSEEYHEDLVDLMYIICSKIHGFPDLLNIFFHHNFHLLPSNPQKALKNSPIDAKQTIISSSDSNQDGNPDDSSSVASSSILTTAKTTEFTEEPEKPEYEFLLFTYLLQFVHREGKSGDFARTGLLFIIELAKDQLGEFIYESDFATIMPSGLGALYSQLPRKLMVKGSSGGLTNATLLGYGDNTSAELERLRSGGIEVSSSPQFISQLDSFLKLLEFCQDVLNRCPNTEISLALLQNIKTLFLENILYPSLMECSDTDGSAVAVISYIDIILQTLEQEELVDVVVGFLMDSDSDDEDFWKKKNKSKMQKRQSTINLNLFAGVEASPITSSPYFTATGRFTLKDLILSRLKSSSQQIVIAALKLLHTVISKHCRYSLKLLNIELDESATCFPRPNYLDETHDHEILGSNSFTPAPPKLTTISHHLKELDLFFSLISTADQRKIFANGYECYVHDAEAITEADLCYRNGQEVEWSEDGPTKPKGSKNNRKPILAYSERKNGEKDSAKGISCVPKHRLIPTDKHNPSESLLQILIGILSNFFAHSPELNIALTGVISALAICPYRSLEGWLVFSGADRVDRRDSSAKDLESFHADAKNFEISPSVPNHDLHVPSEDDDESVNEFDDEDDRSVDYNADQSPSAAKAIGATHGWKNFPPFFTIFKTLTQQVDYYRSEIEDFNQFLEVRRNGLLDSEDEIDENFFRQPSSSVVPIRSRRSSNATQNSLASSGSPLSTSPSNKTRKSSSATHHGRSLKRSNSLVQGDSSSSNLPPLRSSSNFFTPLSTHFRETEGIKIQPLFPAHFVNEDEVEEPTEIGDEEDEEMPSSKKQTKTKTKESKPKEITLSSLLNNVVILEEAVKELVAVVQVRRSLGIDEVRYL